ncbi:MAG: TolC family protein [Desulfovibrionaceae bacterium]|nr:TolC family protein [Desulfovibrionaceae bacterium]
MKKFFCILSLLLVWVAFVPSITPQAKDKMAGDASKPIHKGRKLATKPLPVPKNALDMDQTVRRAIQFNPSLGSHEAQQESSEAARKSARGAFGPKLGMTYSASKQERKMETYYSSTARLPEKGTYTLSIEVSQPIFQGLELLARYQRAALQADSDKAQIRNAELAMAQNVQSEFLNYLRYVESAKSRKESLDRLLDQLAITTAFYEVGLRPRIDVLQAEVDVRQAENTLIQMENGRDTSQAHLNTLIGLPVGSPVKYVGDLAYVPFKRTLEQCLETAYRMRPDLYIAMLAVDISRKSQQEVQAGYYPHIEAYWNMTNTGNTPDLQKSGNYGSRSSVWEVGARATWDVFQWGTTYYADKEAGALVTKMRYALEDLRLNVGYEVKSRFLAVREAEKRIAVSEKAVEQAKEAYNVAQTRYQEQVGTNFDVLDASSNLTLAESNLTGAKADYFTALSQLYVSMGEYHPNLLRP